jgi:tripartite-type tricarboxylate transporter receptor subunit TctC
VRIKAFIGCWLGAIALGGLTTGAAAQPYPTQKITLLVAFAPGGVADTVARLVGQGLGERLKQSVVVENHGGAGGNIAAAMAARAPADGYTLLATTTALAINETLREQKQFNAQDFVTVAIVASSPESLIVNPDNPARTLDDLVKSGKPVNFGSAGVGSGSHIMAEYFFKTVAKIPAQHIPFQGGAPATNALLGNQIDVLATTLGGGAAAQITAGKLKGLGIASERRVAATPDVPTFTEAGYRNFYAASWVGFFAPAKTDPKVVASLNEAINETVRSATVRERLGAIGFDPIAGSPSQAQAMFESEIRKWGAMVKALGITVK